MCILLLSSAYLKLANCWIFCMKYILIISKMYEKPRARSGADQLIRAWCDNIMSRWWTNMCMLVKKGFSGEQCFLVTSYSLSQGLVQLVVLINVYFVYSTFNSEFFPETYQHISLRDDKSYKSTNDIYNSASRKSVEIPGPKLEVK